MTSRAFLSTAKSVARPAFIGIALPVLGVLLVLVRLLLFPIKVMVVAGFGGSLFMGWHGHYLQSVSMAGMTVLLAIPVGLYYIGAERLGLHDVQVRVRR